MKEKIRKNIDRPETLEKQYRENKKEFTSCFISLYPDIGKHELAKFWKVRLDYENSHDSISRFWGYDILYRYFYYLPYMLIFCHPILTATQ